MAHVHDSDVEIVDRTVVDRTGGSGASGALVAIVAIVVLAAIAFAVLWTRPWDDNSTKNTGNQPGITDNSGGQQNAPASGGDSSGGTSGGSQPGGAPAP